MRQLLRLALCVAALCAFSSVARAETLLSLTGRWTLEILPDGVTYPVSPLFNGTRTVNVHGTSVWDVPLPSAADLGLLYADIAPIAINDVGIVLGRIQNAAFDDGTLVGEPFHSPGAYVTDGVTAKLLGDYTIPVGINNLGHVLTNPRSAWGLDLWNVGSVPLPWANDPPYSLSFFDPRYGEIVFREGIDINDAGQILVRLTSFYDAPGSNPDATALDRFGVLAHVTAPVPEPHAYAIALAGFTVLLLAHRSAQRRRTRK